eukprot:2667720-Prymnesium_polylepis.1
MGARRSQPGRPSRTHLGGRCTPRDGTATRGARGHMGEGHIGGEGHIMRGRCRRRVARPSAPRRQSYGPRHLPQHTDQHGRPPDSPETP